MGNPLSLHPSVVGTIAGGPVSEPCDDYLSALWRHDSAMARLSRQERAALIERASRMVIEGGY